MNMPNPTSHSLVAEGPAARIVNHLHFSVACAILLLTEYPKAWFLGFSWG